MLLHVNENGSNLAEVFAQASRATGPVAIELPRNTALPCTGDNLALAGRAGVTIRGNGATLQGAGNGTALLLECSHILVENLRVQGYFAGILARAEDASIENITIRGCEFRDIASEATACAIMQSGLEIDGLTIEDCFFEAPGRSRGGHCSCATNLTTASYSDNAHPVRGTKLRNVKWLRNRLVPNPADGNLFSLGFTAHGACNHAFYEGTEMLESSYNDASRSVQENFLIADNTLDGVHDIGITVLAALPGKSDCLLQNVEISGNTVTYNNTGINVGATNIPCNGSVRRCITRNVVVGGNTLIPRVPGPFEPQIGIMLFTVRAESQTIDCRDCHLEDVIVTGNKVKGREVGIALQAFHATQDLPHPSRLENCSLRRVAILGNTVREAQQPLRIFTAHLEGRYDDFWGYPLAEFDTSLPYSTLCRNGVIDDVLVRNNELVEYDCAFTLGAAWACGHGYVKDNALGPNICITGNRLDGGRKVFCHEKYVTGEILYEHATGTNNRVLGALTMDNGGQTTTHWEGAK